jgi:hypothetical protein
MHSILIVIILIIMGPPISFLESAQSHIKIDQTHDAFVGFVNSTGVTQSPGVPLCNTTRVATDASTFNVAVGLSSPGDCIEFPSGSYDLGAITIATGNDAITIKPQSGTVTFNGTTQFTISSDGIVFYNLTFSMPDVTPGIQYSDGADNGKILFCTFQSYGNDGSDVAVRLLGDDIEVAYNVFDDLYSFAVNLVVAGDNSWQSNRAWVHHNEFRNYRGPQAEGGSVMHIGLGGITNYPPGFDTNAIIEYNRIDDWDGDPELFSVKGNNNIIRYNYITNNHASQHLNVRSGYNNVFYGNIIEWKAGSGPGTANGWRASGDNNYYLYNAILGNNVFLRGFLAFASAGDHEVGPGELAATNSFIKYNIIENAVRDSGVIDNGWTPFIAGPSGNIYSDNYFLGRDSVDTSEFYTDFTQNSDVPFSTWADDNTLGNFAMPFDSEETGYGQVGVPIPLASSVVISGHPILSTVLVPDWFAAFGFQVGDIARYRFDQTAEDSIGVFDGSEIGNPTYLMGKLNQAISLDGDDAVQISGLYNNPTDISICGWGNLTLADSSGSEFISLGDYVVIRFDNAGGTGVIGFFYDGSAWHITSSNVNLVGTGWNHVCYTIDDANNAQKLYINGEVAATSAFTESIGYSGLGANTQIGRHGNGAVNRDFTGSIDDVLVSSRVLAPIDIEILYELGYFPGIPGTPTTTAASNPTFPGGPTIPSTTATGTATLPGVPGTPTDTAASNPAFPDVPGVPTSP